MAPQDGHALVIVNQVGVFQGYAAINSSQAARERGDSDATRRLRMLAVQQAVAAAGEPVSRGNCGLRCPAPHLCYQRQRRGDLTCDRSPQTACFNPCAGPSRQRTLHRATADRTGRDHHRRVPHMVLHVDSGAGLVASYLSNPSKPLSFLVHTSFYRQIC